MRPVHFVLGLLLTASFAGMFGAAFGARSLDDWIVPVMIGICMAASIVLTLFAPRAKKRCD